MLEVDDASEILYRYLRTLKVKVGRNTVNKLLDCPSSNTLQSMSNALDALHIKNAIHQLPAVFIHDTQIPFIVTLESKETPFGLVEQVQDNKVIITTPHASRLQLSKYEFLQQWKGGMLAGELTKETLQDSFYWLENIKDEVLQHKVLVVGLITLLFGIILAFNSNFPAEVLFYLSTLCAGILISSAIIYKETVNKFFLHHICHVGKIVDCNAILHSKKSTLIGLKLSELSLLYFIVLFFFTLTCPNGFYPISVIFGLIATFFTFYSIGCQAFIVHKCCIFCTLTNLAIWSNMLAIYLMRDLFQWSFSLQIYLSLTVIGCVFLTGWILGNTFIEANKERLFLKKQLSQLLNPITFQKLLALKPTVEEMIKPEFALRNHIEKSENHLMIIINPNCMSCAETFKDIIDLSRHLSISLVLVTAFTDRLGERVAQTILSAYHNEGWEQALDILSEWYDTNNIKEIGKYPITPAIYSLCCEQQHYCSQHNITQTPSVIINKHYMPSVYQLNELKYILA